jgi:hypothetical protein
MSSKSWREYPHIVTWVSEMNDWAQKYEIYEFIPADTDGYDPSGKLESGPSDNLADRIDLGLVWTELLESEELIISEYKSGDWGSGGVYGWYIGRVSHQHQEITFAAGKFACSICEGLVNYETEDGEEADCEQCEMEDPALIRLSDTDFKLSD